MSLLQVVIQAQILAEAGEPASGKRKGCGSSTVGNEHPMGGPTTLQSYGSHVWLHSRLQRVFTRFGLAVLTESDESAMELDVLSAGNLKQDPDCLDMETSCVSNRCRHGNRCLGKTASWEYIAARKRMK